MTESPTGLARRDLVVILARGESRRMGMAKGLVPCPAKDPGRVGLTMLGAITASYRELALDCLVVTTPNLVDAYGAVVGEVATCRVVAAGPGGQTAETVWWGWQGAAAGTTHLWAHPVDVPLVAVETLRRLQTASAGAPGRVLRPTFERQPGHPVILPVSSLAGLGDHAVWRNATMSAALRQGVAQGRLEPLLLISVPDKGVVRDFDSPADLEDS